MPHLNRVTRFLVAALLCLLTGSLAPAVHADNLSEPTGPVLLTIDGAIENTNGDGIALIDRDMLSALPQHTLSTHNPFETGLHTFQGPLLRDLLAAVGANGTVLIAEALDGYTIEIPVEDSVKYDVVMATSWNGKVMTVRNKGPIWIVYPVDQHEILTDEIYSGRSIWQLSRITVE